MNNFEKILTDKLMPISEKMTSNKILGSLMEGFVRCLPITMGIALLTIIGNFPIPSWMNFIESSGLKEHFNAITNGATGVMSIYIVYNIASSYAKKLNTNEKNAAILSLASFIMLLPHTLSVQVLENGSEVNKIFQTLSLDYLGGQGIFLGMMVALVITRLYAYLSTKNMKIKLPDSVPSMVTQSLEPFFVATIIFVLVFIVRVLFGMTASGNILTFFIDMINQPLSSIAASPLSIIIILELLAVFWFFGIHNAVFSGPVNMILLTVMTANITAYQQGQPLPYLTTTVVYFAASCSGFMGIVILMMFRCKSQRYKKMAKIAIIPSIFNITEPFMFGVPVNLNPMYFIPQSLCTLVGGFVSWILCTTILPVTMNPTMMLIPWTTPYFIKGPLLGGINFTIIMLICFALTALIWYPFIKASDEREYEKELALEKVENNE